MTKKKEFADEIINSMINDYINNKIPVMTIAKNHDVDFSVVKRILKENNVDIVNGSAFSKKYWIKRGLNEKEAEQKCKEFKPCCVEYWLNKGYDEENAKLKVELHLMNTERAYTLKYGDIEGKIKFKEKKRKDGELNSPRKISYWINKGYSENESKTLLFNFQNNFSLVKCIDKYGEKEGKLIFSERQEKWQNSLNKNGNLKIGYSKISQELFYILLEEYKISDKNFIFFATHNKEFSIKKEDGGILLYDFTDIKNKKIIEYNGDMFHANPKKYLSEDTPHPFNKQIKSIDIWEKDSIKIELAKKHGFNVLIIWDSEYRWGNKQKIIDKCIKFLKNE